MMARRSRREATQLGVHPDVERHQRAQWGVRRPRRQHNGGLVGVRPVAEAPDRIVRPATHQDRVDAGEEGGEAEILGRVIRDQPVIDGPVQAGDPAVQ
jgi:hypothetical protein